MASSFFVALQLEQVNNLKLRASHRKMAKRNNYLMLGYAFSSPCVRFWELVIPKSNWLINRLRAITPELKHVAVWDICEAVCNVAKPIALIYFGLARLGSGIKLADFYANQQV